MSETTIETAATYSGRRNWTEAIFHDHGGPLLVDHWGDVIDHTEGRDGDPTARRLDYRGVDAIVHRSPRGQDRLALRFRPARADGTDFSIRDSYRDPNGRTELDRLRAAGRGDLELAIDFYVFGVARGTTHETGLVNGLGRVWIIDAERLATALADGTLAYDRNGNVADGSAAVYVDPVDLRAVDAIAAYWTYGDGWTCWLKRDAVPSTRPVTPCVTGLARPSNPEVIA